jgi:hypothetical protein
MNIATGIGVANFGDRAVILDCRTNRYRQLGARHAAVLASIEAGQSADDKAALDTLITAGIVDPHALPKTLATEALVPIESVLELPLLPTLAMPTRRISLALIEAMLRLRWTSFESVVAWVLALRQDDRPTISDAALIELALAYDRTRPRIPVRRICLRDSLALFSILTRAGGRCSLVFGVRLDPFSAHCWVQADGVILSDTLESALHMRPILVL